MPIIPWDAGSKPIRKRKNLRMASPTPISRRGLVFLAGAVWTLSVVAPTIAWSDDRQIVSTVADAALAVARAGGSPSAYNQLLIRYAAVQGVALFALGRYRSQLPPGQRGQYVALATDYAAKMLSRYSKSFAGERFVVKSDQGGVVRGRIIFANGQTSAVDWRVFNGRIVDINFEGKWLTVQMRDQFTRVLASSNDFAVLFQFLKTGPR
jgi:phospholipid transport system substrate-binding protein